MFSVKSNMIIQCNNGRNYTKSEDNSEDDTDRNITVEYDLNAGTNYVDMSMQQERKYIPDSLRSEVRDSARSADKEMIKQNIHH